MHWRVPAAILCGAFTMGSAQASFLTFFGEDSHDSSTEPLSSYPKAAGAESDFLSHLSGTGTEDFESFDVGDDAPSVSLSPALATPPSPATARSTTVRREPPRRAGTPFPVRSSGRSTPATSSSSSRSLRPHSASTAWTSATSASSSRSP